MARMVTLPVAIAIERAPIFEGRVGDAEQMRPRAHVDIHAAKAIYGCLGTAARRPSVCVELGDVLWRFVMTNDILVEHWADELIRIAAVR